MLNTLILVVLILQAVFATFLLPAFLALDAAYIDIRELIGAVYCDHIFYLKLLCLSNSGLLDGRVPVVLVAGFPTTA